MARRGEGVETLRDWIELHADHLRETDGLVAAQRDVARAATELDHILRDRLIAALLAHLPPGHLDATIAAIARREIDPYTASAQRTGSVLMKASIIYNPAAGQWPFRDEVHLTADFLASNGWDVLAIEESARPRRRDHVCSRGGGSRL